MSMPLVHLTVWCSYLVRKYCQPFCSCCEISLFYTDGREQLRSVLSPYQKGAAEAGESVCVCVWGGGGGGEREREREREGERERERERERGVSFRK